MRRRLVILGLCLLAGAAINVLVAWVIGVSVNPGKLAFARVSERNDWPIEPPEFWPRPDFTISSHAFGFRHRGASAGLERGRIGPSYVMNTRLYGWPIAGLRTRDVGITQNNTYTPLWPGAYYGGLMPPRFLNNGVLAYHRLALEPLWPGFAVNTVSFGGAVWIAVLGAFAARRVRRRRGGRCINCGYTLEDLPICPECGTPARREAAAP